MGAAGLTTLRLWMPIGVRQIVKLSESAFGLIYSVTLWQAASFTRTLKFLDIGTIITLPIILAHLGYVHWTFRGKTRLSSGYGH